MSSLFLPCSELTYPPSVKSPILSSNPLSVQCVPPCSTNGNTSPCASFTESPCNQIATTVGPSVFCMQQSGSAFTDPSGTAYPANYVFGINPPNSNQILAPPANACSGDQTCLLGMRNSSSDECCNDSVGFVLSSAYLTSTEVLSTCVPDAIDSTGCYPCSASNSGSQTYIPVVQGHSYNANNSAAYQYATFYQCLQTQVTVSLAITAGSSCDPGADGIFYTVYNSLGQSIDVNIWANKDQTGYVYLNDGDYMTVSARADCCCPDVVHQQWTAPVTIKQSDIVQLGITDASTFGGGLPVVNILFSGSPKCVGFFDTECSNGDIALTVKYCSVNDFSTCISP